MRKRTWLQHIGELVCPAMMFSYSVFLRTEQRSCTISQLKKKKKSSQGSANLPSHSSWNKLFGEWFIKPVFPTGLDENENSAHTRKQNPSEMAFTCEYYITHLIFLTIFLRLHSISLLPLVPSCSTVQIYYIANRMQWKGKWFTASTVKLLQYL